MRKGFWIGTVVLAAATAANAGTLNLIQVTPDIKSSKVGVSYDALNAILKVTAPSMPTSSIIGGATADEAEATLTIEANVTSAGTLGAGPSTIKIEGQLYQGGVDVGSFGTILEGSITKFEYNGTGAARVFEFAFTPTGGSMQSEFGTSGGALVSVFNLVDSGLPGLFAGAFSAAAQNSNVADTFAVGVPSPVAVHAGLVLTGALVAVRRRRSVLG